MPHDHGDLEQPPPGESGFLPKLISVHFPKAAGTSLLRAYEAAFGPESVLGDYANDPVDPCSLINLHPSRYEETKPNSLGNHRAVHGHFHMGAILELPMRCASSLSGSL
jgi:hypothetical protein